MLGCHFCRFGCILSLISFLFQNKLLLTEKTYSFSGWVDFFCAHQTDGLFGLPLTETGSEDDGLLDLSEDDFFLSGSSSDEADADDEWTDKSTRYTFHWEGRCSFLTLFLLKVLIFFSSTDGIQVPSFIYYPLKKQCVKWRSRDYCSTCFLYGVVLHKSLCMIF